MCWNKDISINTFCFSFFVLLLILYNNTYTQYKIQFFSNIWVYLFFCSFIFIQLIEYFIWSNISNKRYNSLFSTIAILLILIQPLASLMLIEGDNTVRRNMILLYISLAIPFTIYQLYVQQIYSTISVMGHLQWNSLLSNNMWLFFIWLFFFLFSFIYNRNFIGFATAIILLLIIVYNFYYDQSICSMWCWIANSIMLFLAGYLLLYLPFTQTQL